MVAAALGATVDLALKKKLMRDVGAFFIGYALPDVIRHYIREVSQTSVVRRDHRVGMAFTPSGDDVTIDVSERWNVFNYSSGLSWYPPCNAINLSDPTVRTVNASGAK